MKTLTATLTMFSILASQAALAETADQCLKIRAGQRDTLFTQLGLGDLATYQRNVIERSDKRLIEALDLEAQTPPNDPFWSSERAIRDEKRAKLNFAIHANNIARGLESQVNNYLYPPSVGPVISGLLFERKDVPASESNPNEAVRFVKEFPQFGYTDTVMLQFPTISSGRRFATGPQLKQIAGVSSLIAILNRSTTGEASFQMLTDLEADKKTKSQTLAEFVESFMPVGCKEKGKLATEEQIKILNSSVASASEALFAPRATGLIFSTPEAIRDAEAKQFNHR